MVPGFPDLFDEHFICFLGKGVVLRCDCETQEFLVDQKSLLKAWLLFSYWSTSTTTIWRMTNRLRLEIPIFAGNVIYYMESKKKHGVTCREIHATPLFSVHSVQKCLSKLPRCSIFVGSVGPHASQCLWMCQAAWKYNNQTGETLIHSRGSCAPYLQRIQGWVDL